jgi:hypothetical protein
MAHRAADIPAKDSAAAVLTFRKFICLAGQR